MFTQEFIDQLADAVATKLAVKLSDVAKAKHETFPAVMSLRTAAKYIDRSYDTLWLMVKNQEIPAVRHGTRQFIRREDLDKWAEKRLV